MYIDYRRIAALTFICIVSAVITAILFVAIFGSL